MDIATASEYPAALAQDDDAIRVRLQRIARLRDDYDRQSRESATRTWTRDDLYDRPYRHYYGQ